MMLAALVSSFFFHHSLLSPIVYHPVIYHIAFRKWIKEGTEDDCERDEQNYRTDMRRICVPLCLLFLCSDIN